jgi:predicted nucleic acid-binding protein
MIPFTMFSDKLKEAMDLNFKDSPYLALAMTYNCPIFSGDKGLKKQKKVSVFSPRELLDKITNE